MLSSTAVALCSARVTGGRRNFSLVLLYTFANDDWWARNRAV